MFQNISREEMDRLKTIHINAQKTQKKIKAEFDEKEGNYANLVNEMRERDILHKALSETLVVSHYKCEKKMKCDLEKSKKIIEELDGIISSKETTAAGHVCVVCKDKLAVFCSHPCHHLLFCERCNVQNEDMTCPCCRSDIQHIFKIFS
jgi:hypothetical protein